MTIPVTIPGNHSQNKMDEHDQKSGEGQEFLACISRAGNVTERVAKAYNILPAQAVNWRWHMKHQITRAEDCPPALLGLSTDDSAAFEALAPVFTSGITPYYAGIMNPDPNVACPVRLQALPSMRELYDPSGRKDPLDEVPHSPVKEVVQVYPDRVAF